MKKVLAQTLRFFGSHGLTVVILILMSVLTLLGTLVQGEMGLYEAQQKYFSSFFLVHHFGNVPLPLPGGFLLMSLFFVNLICGGILRARKGWSHIGILIAHLGAAFLLLGGFVTYKYSVNGYLALYKNERASHFESNSEWELVIAGSAAPGSTTEFIIPAADFSDVGPDGTRSFHAAGLPFSLTVSDYAEHAALHTGSHGDDTSRRSVEGAHLEALAPMSSPQQNRPGAYVTIQPGEAAAALEAIVWGGARAPASFAVGDREWTLALRLQRWELPFEVTLKRFTRELYPRTNIPKAFESEVTMVEGDTSQDVIISMNAPLRQRGLTLFQSSWGPQNAKPGDRLYSVFAVVQNPADKFPLYACLIVTLGLFVHFSQRLIKYLRAESRKRP
jgi:ResB-like family protein